MTLFGSTFQKFNQGKVILHMNHNQKLDLVQNIQLIAGIDISKHAHIAALCNNRGNEIKVSIKIDNNCDGFDEFENLLATKGKPHEIMLAMEPTGHYYKAFADYFGKKGYRIVLINSYHAKISKEIGTSSKNKNDSCDSRLLARLAVQGSFMETLSLTGNYAELRKLTLFHQKLVSSQTAHINRLRTILDEYLPEFDKLFKDIASITSLAVLEKYSLTQLRSKELVQDKIDFIIKRARGQIKAKHAETVINSFTKSIGPDAGIISAQCEIFFLIEQIRRTKQIKQSLEKPMVDLLETLPETQYLSNIRGFGPVSLAFVLGQLGSFDQYTNAKQLEKIAGLNLVENQSGKYKGKVRLNKRGRDVLRHKLFLIALVLIVHNPMFKKYYDDRTKIQKKSKMSSLMAVSQKFIRLIFGLVKNKSEYVQHP